MSVAISYHCNVNVTRYFPALGLISVGVRWRYSFVFLMIASMFGSMLVDVSGTSLAVVIDTAVCIVAPMRWSGIAPSARFLSMNDCTLALELVARVIVLLSKVSAIVVSYIVICAFVASQDVISIFVCC